MSAKVHSGLNGEKSLRAERTVKSFEGRVRDSDIEHMMILDRNGNVIEEVEGLEDEVTYTTPYEMMKDTITSHNHPDAVFENGDHLVAPMYSPDDLVLMAYNDEYESRVVTSVRTYILRRMGAVASDKRNAFAKAYAEAWDRAEAKANAVAKKYLALGKFPDTEQAYMRFANNLANRYLRKWMRNNSLKYGYAFEEHIRRR